MTGVNSVDCPDVIDLLTELVNIGVGRAAAALSDLTEYRVELNVPQLRLVQLDRACPQIAAMDAENTTVVIQDFQGEIRGRSALAFSEESGLTLASILSGVEAVESELDIELQGVLLELGNILLNNVMGTLSNEAGVPLSFSLPTVHSGTNALQCLFGGSEVMLDDLMVADVQFRISERQIHGSVLIVFHCGSVMRLANLVRATLQP